MVAQEVIPYFSLPYPEESFYSEIARYGRHTGKIPDGRLLLELYGSRAVHALVDLPVRISQLVNRTPVQYYMTAEEIIHKHTLLPFYSAFLGRERSKLIMSSMLSGEGIDRFANIFSGYNLDNSTMRFCSECLKEDYQKYGEPYWHRIWRIPGVDVCLKHRTFLTGGCRICGQQYLQHKKQYQCLDLKCECGQQFCGATQLVRGNEIDQKQLNYAEDAWTLLIQQAKFEPDYLRHLYTEKLKELGFATFHGAVRVDQLANKLIDYYGREFLRLMGSLISIDSQDCWFLPLLRKPKSTIHPVRHMLLIRFLFGSVGELISVGDQPFKPFGDGPWPCLNPASNHYGQASAQLICMKRHKSKRPFGVFSCKCGFVYTRIGPDKSPEDRYNRSYILHYGEQWKSALADLFFNQKLNLSQIARLFGVCQPTVRNHLEKLRSGQKIDSYRHWNDSERETIKETYREKMIRILGEHPNITRSQLENMAKKEYAWLLDWDSEWFEQQLPCPLPRINNFYALSKTY